MTWLPPPIQLSHGGLLAPGDSSHFETNVFIGLILLFGTKASWAAGHSSADWPDSARHISLCAALFLETKGQFQTGCNGSAVYWFNPFSLSISMVFHG